MSPAGRNTLWYKMFLSHQHAPTHPPIFLPFELLSTFLSTLPLLLCVCQGTRAVRWQNKASRQKHHIQLPKRVLGNNQAAQRGFTKLRSSSDFSLKAGPQRQTRNSLFQKFQACQQEDHLSTPLTQSHNYLQSKHQYHSLTKIFPTAADLRQEHF